MNVTKWFRWFLPSSGPNNEGINSHISTLTLTSSFLLNVPLDKNRFFRSYKSQKNSSGTHLHFWISEEPTLSAPVPATGDHQFHPEEQSPRVGRNLFFWQTSPLPSESQHWSRRWRRSAPSLPRNQNCRSYTDECLQDQVVPNQES